MIRTQRQITYGKGALIVWALVNNLRVDVHLPEERYVLAQLCISFYMNLFNFAIIGKSCVERQITTKH